MASRVSNSLNTHQRQKLARRDFQMQVLQHVDVLRAAVKDLLHPIHVHQRMVGRFSHAFSRFQRFSATAAPSVRPVGAVHDRPFPRRRRRR